MKNKMAKYFCVGLALATPVSASADVFTLDRNSGQLYQVDASNYSVTPIGVPLDGNFLSSLTKHSNGKYPNIDLTYLDGYIYGLVGNTRPNDSAMLFRLTPQGVLDLGFGTAGVKTLSLEGQSPFKRSVEGLASNGTNLLIGHSTENAPTPFSSVISEYILNTDTVLNRGVVSSFSGAPGSSLTDMDGLGALNARAMSVDIRNSKSHVIDLGQLPNGNFNDIYNISSGAFGDIAFISEDKFVVAGDYAANDVSLNGLHFFSNVGGQPTYIASANFPKENGIFAVASTTENDDIVVVDGTPLPWGTPNLNTGAAAVINTDAVIDTDLFPPDVATPGPNLPGCCPPWNETMLKESLKYQGSGNITDPYTLRYMPAASVNAQMEAYINYLNALDPGVTSITVHFRLWDKGQTPSSSGLGSQLGNEHFVKWTAGGSSAPSNGGGNFFNLPSQGMNINNWYRITSGVYINGDKEAFGKDCANIEFLMNIEVKSSGMKRAGSRGGNDGVTLKTYENGRIKSKVISSAQPKKMERGPVLKR